MMATATTSKVEELVRFSRAVHATSIDALNAHFEERCQTIYAVS